MGRRNRNRSGDTAELVVKAIVGSTILLALGTGGMAGFGARLNAILGLVLGVGLLLAIGVILFALGRWYAGRNRSATSTATTVGSVAPSLPPVWTAPEVESALGEIDWYQFEKFCAALLAVDGFAVQRMGGAHPDEGVDLIVDKGGTRGLIQCKHWRTWVVQEKVVREMLGSMTHFQVSHGAIYTLKGWTAPAAQFAALHNIVLVKVSELAASAASHLSPAKLDELLRPGIHHCPKCEAPMVERTGAFGSFWGCSTYPRCRGKLKHAGAR
jgi:hypothetical protein